MNVSTQAFLISLIPPLCWGTMWLFIKETTKSVDAIKAQFLFQLVGIPILLALGFFLPAQPSHTNYLLIIGPGLLEAFVLTLYFYAIQIGDLAVIGPVKQVSALITVALSVLILHESLHLPKAIGILAIVLGVILLGLKLHTFRKGVSLYRGVAPALVAATGTGVYLFLAGISSRANGWYATSLGIRVTIPLALLGYILMRKRNIPDLFKNVPWRWAVPAVILDVIAFSALTYATTKYDVSYVTMMSKAAPVISTLFPA